MPFIYMESSPALSGKARRFGAAYRRMAVVEIEPGAQPKMISSRARGVVRVVDEATESVGTTERSYGYRERARLRALADELNAKETPA